jgi:hypothetical protein
VNKQALRVLVELSNVAVVEAGDSGIDPLNLYRRVKATTEVCPAALSTVVRRMVALGAWETCGLSVRARLPARIAAAPI